MTTNVIENFNALSVIIQREINQLRQQYEKDYASSHDETFRLITVRTFTDPKNLPPGYKGWMCGEVESKQWVYPPAVIIWYCLKSNEAWGAITPKRPSTEWFIYPDRYGIVTDQRKSLLTNETHYIYPSYCVPPERIISKDKVITYIQQLAK